MSNSGLEIESRIKLKARRGEFLGQLLLSASKNSSGIHGDYVEKVTPLAKSIRQIFEDNGLINTIDYQPKSYWPSLKGSSYGFIDGGVADIDIPSSAPIGIRVGSYVVRPGDQSENREEFNMELCLVDDLFGQNALVYDDVISEIDKLRDAARVISECSSGLKVAESVGDIAGVFIHGPLVIPVAPYGTDDFPAFTQEAANALTGENKSRDEKDRGFIALYLEILEKIKGLETPVIGVVERSMSSKPTLIKLMLDFLKDQGVLKRKSLQQLNDEIDEYLLSDPQLLGLILSPGEYVRPFVVDRQAPENKWPNAWKSHIRDYPHPNTTFLKISEDTDPFRVESFAGGKEYNHEIELLYYTSKLLPKYGFPVGLDIVDKFAKVPAWMSRSVRGHHATILLKRALESKDPKMMEYAKKVLAARGRDWLFRPK